MKRTKSRRGRSTMKNKTRNNRKRLRGGCGCGQSILGGSANLDALPVRYYYDLNSEVDNPNYLKGGKKRRIRGGNAVFLTNNPTIGVVGGLGYSGFNDATVQPDMINGTKQYFA